MSEWLPPTVRDSSSCALKLVYRYLTFVDEPQSTKTIATETGLARRSVQYAVDDLHDDDLVERITFHPNPHHCHYRLRD